MAALVEIPGIHCHTGLASTFADIVESTIVNVPNAAELSLVKNSAAPNAPALLPVIVVPQIVTFNEDPSL